MRLEGRRGVPEEPYQLNSSRLRLAGDRRKCEAGSENDREPDPPHEHLGGDGWRESSGPRLLAAAGRCGRARYSMTLSACSRSFCGIEGPRAFAVFRLITRSNLGWLRDREIARLRALEDLVHKMGRAATV